ncbi:hypothetical protein D3C86_2200150 [compost metagenome]
MLGGGRPGHEQQGKKQQEALDHGVCISVELAPGVSGKVTVARENVQTSVRAS